MKPLTPVLHKIHGWQAMMAEQAGLLGVPAADVMAVLATYDGWLAAGGRDYFQPMDLEGGEIERTYKNNGGREKTVTDYYPTDPADTVQMIAEHVMRWMRQKLTPAVGPVKVKRYRRTKEAIRKAKARATGRVKPRAKKGPPTVEARIAATEASLVTRRAKLAALKADPSWPMVAMSEVMRTEVGIARTEKTLATYKTQLKTDEKTS